MEGKSSSSGLYFDITEVSKKFRKMPVIACIKIAGVLITPKL